MASTKTKFLEFKKCFKRNIKDGNQDITVEADQAIEMLHKLDILEAELLKDEG